MHARDTSPCFRVGSLWRRPACLHLHRGESARVLARTAPVARACGDPGGLEAILYCWAPREDRASERAPTGIAGKSDLLAIDPISPADRVSPLGTRGEESVGGKDGPR